MLLDEVKAAIRNRHYSRRTEDTYIGWIRRFILFNGKRHPREMGEAELQSFLAYLAIQKKVSASTQNQALSAILFLYREVLKVEGFRFDLAVRARMPERLSSDEAGSEGDSGSHDAGAPDCGEPAVRLWIAFVGMLDVTGERCGFWP